MLDILQHQVSALDFYQNETGYKRLKLIWNSNLWKLAMWSCNLKTDHLSNSRFNSPRRFSSITAISFCSGFWTEKEIVEGNLRFKHGERLISTRRYAKFGHFYRFPLLHFNGNSTLMSQKIKILTLLPPKRVVNIIGCGPTERWWHGNVPNCMVTRA